MSYKFTSESLRKRIKAMKGKLSIAELERPGMQIRRLKSNDGTADSPVASGDKSPVNGKPLNTKRSNGYLQAKLNGHANGHTNGSENNPPNISRPERLYEVITRNRNARVDSINSESSKSVSFKDEGSRPQSLDFLVRRKRAETQDREAVKPAAASVETTSEKTNSTFIDARTAFRLWPDSELKLQRQVIEKYETGSRLWTKEELIAIEEKITTENPIKLRAFVGKDHVFEKEIGVTYQVELHGYQALAFPPSHRPNGMPYCSISLKTMPFDYSEPRSLETELTIFHTCTALWLTNPIGQHFYSMFMKLPLPPSINKIVCFDLGSITAKPAENYPHTRQAIYRHAAALTIIECLHKRFGCMIRLFAQDTSYTNECAKVLYKKGFSIVGQHGAGGFAEIDDKTLVFAPNPAFCVKEVVADVAEPAAMFWNTVLSPEDGEKASRSTRPLELDDNLTAYYHQPEADPDTPRVRALIKNYDRHPFPVTNLFGSVSLYTRTGMSVCHIPSGEPEGETPTWERSHEPHI
ncbi:hypothetical protein F5Y13DRAFT_29208 [Hypoxylon sp. FL1857]|nr:hypothetical protein F5Y13DRAFT_29208 [Hypoxylon sp. FL1857]